MKRQASRRDFLRLSALTATALAGCGAQPQTAGRPGAPISPATATSGGAAGGGGMGAGAAANVPERFASFVTPNEYFYITTYSAVEPELSAADWSRSRP